MTNIIVSSKLTSPIRSFLSCKPGPWQMFAYLMKCPMCVGFWVGVFWWSMSMFPSVDGNMKWLMAGMVGSGTTWMIRVVLAKLGEDSL